MCCCCCCCGNIVEKLCVLGLLIREGRRAVGGVLVLVLVRGCRG